MREKYYSLVEKVQLISQANRAKAVKQDMDNKDSRVSKEICLFTAHDIFMIHQLESMHFKELVVDSSITY